MKNNHLIHLEDLILTEGELGLHKVNRVLSALNRGDMSKFSVKFDGAPAIFFGTDPNDNKKFIATKGIFNKKPIILKSKEDIDSYIKYPSLRDRLNGCFRYLPKVAGVVQADLLFASEDITINRIYLQDYCSFIPNIIQYNFLFKHPVSSKIRKARYGIVPHTYYTISEDLKLTMVEPFNVEYDDNIYVQDVIPNISLNAFNILIDLPDAQIDTSISTSEMNRSFRNNERFPYAESDTHSLYFEIMEVKNDLLTFFNIFNKDSDYTKKFILHENGKIQCGHEGLVYKDDDIFCKLVNREVFSTANFSEDVTRGWNFNK